MLVPPNKRLKLAAVDRFKGSGVLCPWRGTDCRPTALRRQVGRPQLKRDPLGGGCRHIAHTVHVVTIPIQSILGKWQKATGLRSIIRCGIRPDWQSTAP